MKWHKKISIYLGSVCLIACTHQPPSQRPPVTADIAPGNVQAGRQVYESECQQCHSTTPGNNRKGPQLDRIFNAKAASLSDYQERYSSVLKKTGWKWDRKHLDQYIKDPKLTLPKGKMLYDGLANPVDRQNVIAYLSTLRSKSVPTTQK